MLKQADEVCAQISRREFLGGAAASLALSMVPTALSASADSPASAVVAAVRINPHRLLNAFDPDLALGSSMDALPESEFDKVYTPEMVKECLTAGWGPITYRQNTELQGAAWHWNPEGVWSDPAQQSGYFTGSTEPGAKIRRSYGYPLPHRGQTRQEGIERGYSRMTDGNPNTYWKSNPYLAHKYTGEDDSLHPQWVVLDLGATQSITTLRIQWANPYARVYEVQYWDAATSPMDHPTSGKWVAFPNGKIANGKGGTETLTLAPSPMPVQFLRIWMTDSSNTCSTHDPKDPRSYLGYAITELYAGSIGADGTLVDLVRHSPDVKQTATYCSSADPWHAATNLNLHSVQTGFDLFFESGYTNKLPAMIPVAAVYGTPEDAAAQIAYLKKRGYSFSHIEIGEEPDGQYMLPEDYAELYLQCAAAIKAVDPSLKLGGPSLTGLNEDLKAWPDAQGQTSWVGRFVDYLKARGRLRDLEFFSFEHYPYEPCGATWGDLTREPELIGNILRVWRDAGVPESIPLMNTESNVTWSLSQMMTDIFSGLWLADSVGAFFAAGGAMYYHSPIQPEPLSRGCDGHTTYGNFVADKNLRIRTHTAQYHAGRMLNLDWVKHRAGVHRLFSGVCDLVDTAGRALITAYPILRPDGEWAVLLVNKDQTNPHVVRIAVDGQNGLEPLFAGSVAMVTFGSEQYMWRPDGVNSHPDPDRPPVATTVAAAPDGSFTLPKASVTVLRGKPGSGKLG